MLMFDVMRDRKEQKKIMDPKYRSELKQIDLGLYDVL